MIVGPRLPPRIHPSVAAFLSRTDLLTGVTARYGSPVNVVFPQILADNAGALREVLDRHPVGYRIWYAHKANRARAFVRAAEAAGLGLDVASAGELRHALDCAVPPGRIEATGPKGAALLRELVAAGVVVNVDNGWELAELARAATGDVPVRVLLRLCPAGRTSRFGTPEPDLVRLLDVVCAHRGRLELLGFSFHLDTAEVREKVDAIEACLRLFEAASTRGLAPAVLDVGGGLRQVFTADPAGFDGYVQALRAGLAGTGPPLSWDGATFGFGPGGQGVPVFHKYANTVPATASLDGLLRAPLPSHGGRPVARVLADNLVELWLEPGKALLDQAGLTIATVEFTKPAADGVVLVNLDLSRDRICPADQEVMLDPVVVHLGDRPGGRPGPVGVYFAGNLCLERDLVFAHLTFLDALPRPGDLVVFVNTAAYQMDLSASTALMHPPAARVAVSFDGADFTVMADADTGGAGACSTPTSPS